MGFKCGIIGLPNVGKSKLFNALTKAGIETANFPFCTIEPNTGVVAIPDTRLDQLSKIVKPCRTLPTRMKFVDIAGLVKGSSKGKGLGNKFLSNIREMQAIAHVVRCFENDNIIHVTGEINPLIDIDTINTELILSDLDICEQSIRRIQKKSVTVNKNAKHELEILMKCLIHLEKEKMLRTLVLNKKEKASIRYLNFLTLKPTMYVLNISENAFKNNLYFNIVTKFAKKEGSIVVPLCATIEADIAEMHENEKKEFMTDLGIAESGLNRLIRAGYQLLNLQTYFTVGIKEVRAWTIPIGATAAQAAGKIHSDFEKSFIRAKIISFSDFIQYSGEQGAKEAGKMHIEGKNYIVQDGDIMNFLFKT